MKTLKIMYSYVYVTNDEQCKCFLNGNENVNSLYFHEESYLCVNYSMYEMKMLGVDGHVRLTAVRKGSLSVSVMCLVLGRDFLCLYTIGRRLMNLVTSLSFAQQMALT